MMEVILLLDVIKADFDGGISCTYCVDCAIERQDRGCPCQLELGGYVGETAACNFNVILPSKSSLASHYRFKVSLFFLSKV